MTRLKITIITCTFNSDKELKETIESVKKQGYKNIEHLFIDGGSTDGTLEIIKSFYNEPCLISEKDMGLYDAFNKGLKLANGEVIGFLHSGDIFYDDKVVERIALAFDQNDIDYYCSKMLICDNNLNNPFAVLGATPHKQTFRDQLYSSNYFAHPTYYCKKAIIDQVGFFNLKYKIAADIDWLYRLEAVTSMFYFDDNYLVKFRGEGGTSAVNYFTGIKEEFVIRKDRFGLSFELIMIYAYHFLRRSVRFILKYFDLNKVVGFSRKTLLKLSGLK